jgi:methylated-DNA-[protein]-cysteine S-methyltransferase
MSHDPSMHSAALIDSPVGRLLVIGTVDAVTTVTWCDTTSLATANPDSPAAMAAHQLLEYFSGNRSEFDVPIAPAGSDFQQRVWAALQKIRFGQTVTYGDIATRIDSAPRAVGMACGSNPIPIIVPCHRVVASNGRLTGYSAGNGIETKRQLLALEGWQDLFALS